MSTKLPDFAPFEVPELLCPGCGNSMRRTVERHNNGKVSAVVYYCDTCEYGHQSNLSHHMGQVVKYKPKPEPEPLVTKEENGKLAKPAGGAT